VIALIFLFIKARGEGIRRVLLGDRSVIREGLLGVTLVPMVFLAVVLLLGIVLTFVPRSTTSPTIRSRQWSRRPAMPSSSPSSS
jgi:hypothetical protein